MKKDKIKILKNIDPDNPSKTKTPNPDPESWNERDFEEDVSGSDLDIPGGELDDENEDVGSEDEENNYYSIGGDRHHNLEEFEEE